MPVVTAYDTLGPEGLKHSFLETGAKTIFLDPHLLTTLIGPLNEAKSIQNVIYNTKGDVKDEDIKKLKDAHGHLTILSFEELREMGEKNPSEPVPPKPEDLCSIMYTSGSTGPPKGVPLTHRNIVAGSK
jgi:long-chain acyl-CoA synthetase